MTQLKHLLSNRRLHLAQALVCVLACVNLPTVLSQPLRDPSTYSESSLPGYYFTSPSDQIRTSDQTRSVEPLIAATSIPSESTLPGMKLVAKPQTQIPDESQLPQPNKESPANPATPKENTFQDILAASRDRTPWLRLVEAEHTSPIRAIELDASGRNLFTAGEDKVVHHWKLLGEPATTRWQHHATYRWQVQRAELGTILSLTCRGDELFIAGAGADGQQGEIVSINTVTGAWLPPLVDAARGHHSPVLKTRMLNQGPQSRCVSIDHQHGLGLWTEDANRGTWTFRALRKPNASQQYQYAPLDIADPQTLVVASQEAAWTIDFMNVDNGQITKRLRRDAPIANQQTLAHAIALAGDHFRSTEGKSYAPQQLAQLIRDSHGKTVTCLATAPTGQLAGVTPWVAAGDELGFLYVWNPNGQLSLKTVASFVGFRFKSLVFSRDGRYLAASAVNLPADTSIVQWWQLDSDKVPTLLREVRRTAAITAITFTIDASALILGSGRQIEIIPSEQAATPQAIPEQQSILRPSQVVFANELPYRWKFSLANEQVAFDGQELKWLDTGSAKWQNVTSAAQRFANGQWTIASQALQPQAKPETWIMKGNLRIGRLDLDSHYQRRPESQVQQVVWIDDPQGEMKGVAITLSGQNDIWVFALPIAGKNICSLIRVFSGHEGAVISLDCSPDSRYLISSSQDCTVRLWPLIGLKELSNSSATSIVPLPASQSHELWGFDFSVVADKAIASQPIFTGPLYIRGMRDGDQLQEISYETYQPDGTLRRTTINNAQEIVNFLNQPRFDVMVRFIFTRGGAEVPGFQSYAFWREIAAQVIATNREWAIWTPPGFYDASFNGNNLFGWQINRGLEQAPDFYRADRFQATLERPNFIRKLLTAGSIEQAAELVGNQKIRFGDVLQNSIALQPSVKILSPTPGELIDGSQAVIRAEVTVVQGQALASAKAFVSGVVASAPRELARQTLADGRERIELSWQAQLPSDQNLHLQVLCATDEQLVGTDTIRLMRKATEPIQGNKKRTHRKPKLFVLAAGISRYSDSRIPSLDLGAANAEGFMQTVLTQAATLYDVVPLALTDSNLTPHVWQSMAKQLEDEMRDVRPDDLIVLFVSGHGLVDPASGKYFFVTANARYSDLVRQNYRDCLSFEDLMRWSDIPCRKIAILDTCHSGAIQELDSEHLKKGVRALQGDMVLTLTASEGNQLAAEYRGAQASLFTGAIQKTLQQLPDVNRDGLLDWREIVEHVRNQVTVQSLAGTVPQFPTAGPKDLLEVIELPLAASRTGAQALALTNSQP